MAAPDPPTGIYRITSAVDAAVAAQEQRSITLTGGPGNELSGRQPLVGQPRAGQRWLVSHLGNAYGHNQYLIISERTGLVISAANGGNQVATAQYQGPTYPTVRWTFAHDPHDGNSWRITNVENPNLVLDLDHVHGTEVFAFGINNHPAPNQRWNLVAL